MNQPYPPPHRRQDGGYPDSAYRQQEPASYRLPDQSPRPAKDSEQLLAEALRAMASGAVSTGYTGQSAYQGQPATHGHPQPPRQSRGWSEMVLLCTIVGLAAGIIVGMASFYW